MKLDQETRNQIEDLRKENKVLYNLCHELFKEFKDHKNTFDAHKEPILKDENGPNLFAKIMGDT